MLSYLAPYDGKMSIWVRSRGGNDARDRARSGPSHTVACWQGDGRHVLYLQDSGGNENYHLFHVDSRGAAPDLTPGEQVRCLPLAIDIRVSRRSAGHVERAQPARSLMSLASTFAGNATLEAENPGDVIRGSLITLVVRVALAQNAVGDSILRVRDDAASSGASSTGSRATTGSARRVLARRTTLAASVSGSEREPPGPVRPRDGSVHAILEDGSYDVHESMSIPRACALRWACCAIAWNGPPSTADSRRPSRRSRRGEWRLDCDERRRRTPACSSSDAPDAVRLTSTSSTASPERTSLCRPSSAARLSARADAADPHYQARDGLLLHGYLTLPVGLAPQSLPMVLLVHGGPWHRDRWGFDPEVQWLANRGYAVLQVNFRGSTGYGKAFTTPAIASGPGRCAPTCSTHATGQSRSNRRSVALCYLGWKLRRLCGPHGTGVHAGNLHLRRRYRRAIEPEHAYRFSPAVLEADDDPSSAHGRGSGIPRRTVAILQGRPDISAPLLIAQGANDPRCSSARAIRSSR